MPTDDPDSAARLLADLEQEGRRWRGPHPSMENLTAYRAGRLPAAAEAPVRQHLVLCARCQQRLLDYAAFDDDLTAQAASDGAALGAPPAGAWESLSARLAADRAAAPGAGAPGAVDTAAAGAPGGSPVPPAPSELPIIAAPPVRSVAVVPPRLEAPGDVGARPVKAPPIVPKPRAWRDPGYTVAQYRGAVVALAAALVLCCVAFPVWFSSRPPRSAPQAPVALSGPPGVEITRGSNEIADVRLNGAVALPVTGDRLFAVYRVEVYRQGGGIALTARIPLSEVTVTGAAPNAVSAGQPAPAPLLVIPLQGVAAGSYRAVVYGEDGGGPGEVVADFVLRIH